MLESQRSTRQNSLKRKERAHVRNRKWTHSTLQAVSNGPILRIPCSGRHESFIFNMIIITSFIEVHRQKFFNWSLVTMPTPSRRRKSPNFFVFFGFDWEAKFFRYFSLNAMDFLLFSFVTWWEQLKEFMDFSFWCAKRELRVQLSKKTHRSRQLQDLFLSLNDSSIASSQVSEVLPPHHLDRHNAYITASIKELKLSYERSFLNCRS